MTKKKPYMVAMTKKITVESVLYFETLASNSKEAEFLAKKHLKETNSEEESPWIEEAKLSLEHKEYKISKSKVKSVGESSNYHSSSECKICKTHENSKGVK